MSNPKVVFDTALMDFCDEDFYGDNDSVYMKCMRKNIRHEFKLSDIKFVIHQQFNAMSELRWDKKTFTREFWYVKYVKLRMP